MTWCLASASCKNPGIIWDKHQQTSSASMNLPWLSHTHEIPAVVHHHLSLSTNTQHRTNLVQIAGCLAIRATGSYAQPNSSFVEEASWLLCMPFWLDGKYIFRRTSHFFLLSSSSELPTSFRHHHLLTSTAANHGSTKTSARWEWSRIEQNNGRFIQYTTRWDPTTTQTPLSSPRHCKCSHQKYDPWCTVKNCPWNWKQQE